MGIAEEMLLFMGPNVCAQCQYELTVGFRPKHNKLTWRGRWTENMPWSWAIARSRVSQ
jgi:hypothetical protein